jgi:hypothetical protein
VSDKADEKERFSNLDKKKLKELVRDERLIPGIYNYCDRWCERCSFTSRCLNFASSEEDSSDPAAQDMRNEKFWEKIGESFQVALELLKEAAEERGIDLDAIDVEEEQEKRRLNRESAKEHDVCRMAMAYISMVQEWFGQIKDYFPSAEEDADSRPKGTNDDEKEHREATGAEEAMEVLRWYEHQIYVQLMRAVQGQMEERGDPFENEFAKDSDGSAKVALIGMDRSIAAWGEVRGFFPLQGDLALQAMIHLETLRRKVERAFPDARDFIRPGFDEIKLSS